MKLRHTARVYLCLPFILLLLGIEAFSEDKIPPEPQKLTLAEAFMCEEVKEQIPYNPGVVFSNIKEKVYCYSTFDPVPQNTFIYHSWFYRDNLVTMRKLSVRSPRWSTYSRIQLRDADKGPWRVEIRDQAEKLLHVLRFSVTE
ncbi:MAG: DUF2914 domain-containing protein [Pseudomonadota bacterium]